MKAKHRFKKPRRSFRENRLNEEITEDKVRLITDSGTELIDTIEAIKRAKELNVDLVEITKNQEGPIVRLIDYGKFKFEKAKKERENKKKQKVIHIKEIKMGPKIDTGDFDRKCQMAKDFLETGDKVKVTMRFRGREMAHTEIGLEKMKLFCEKLKLNGLVDKEPLLEGRLMTMVLRPKGKKQAERSSSDEAETSKEE